MWKILVKKIMKHTTIYHYYWEEYYNTRDDKRAINMVDQTKKKYIDFYVENPCRKNHETHDDISL
jgi:hypothetical protein